MLKGTNYKSRTHCPKSLNSVYNHPSVKIPEGGNYVESR